ncbi:hypothetical protein [Brevundimonas subvibrioides]|uniref:hypothetical protein n=1 Tax=Brevundimonas subvibrioides TaxID=74313 RepID=UPI0022B3AE22|nr:hypothetical protein [Brevundimonas subvibrioides]
MAALPAGRGIDIGGEIVQLGCSRFGPIFAAGIPWKRVERMRAFTHLRGHLDEDCARINGEVL